MLRKLQFISRITNEFICLQNISDDESSSADEASSESESGSEESDFASGESEDESNAEETGTALSDEDSQLVPKPKSVTFAPDQKLDIDSESESIESSIKTKIPEKR